MPTIRVDEEVYTWLQGQARPFEDTPNSVLRRLAGLDDINKSTKHPNIRKVKQVQTQQPDKTPQTAFREPILKVLKNFGGEGHRGNVLREVEKLMGDQLSDFDKSDITSGGPRWQKSAEWEVRVMREEGLIEPVHQAARGMWVLSEAGHTAAKEL